MVSVNGHSFPPAPLHLLLFRLHKRACNMSSNNGFKKNQVYFSKEKIDYIILVLIHTSTLKQGLSFKIMLYIN